MKRPTKLMNSVEAHCESILADLLLILPVNGTRISVKYNWTWRKVTSRKSSYRSELYSGRFQRLENVDLETRGIEISLHLARYVKSDIDMDKANRVWIENSNDQVYMNTNEFGVASRDGVSPVCQCKSFCKMTSVAPVPDLHPINSTAHRQKLHQIIAGCLT